MVPLLASTAILILLLVLLSLPQPTSCESLSRLLSSSKTLGSFDYLVGDASSHCRLSLFYFHLLPFISIFIDSAPVRCRLKYSLALFFTSILSVIIKFTGHDPSHHLLDSLPAHCRSAYLTNSSMACQFAIDFHICFRLSQLYPF